MNGQEGFWISDAKNNHYVEFTKLGTKQVCATRFLVQESDASPLRDADVTVDPRGRQGPC